MKAYALDDYAYQVVGHKPPIISFPETEEYDELRYPSHYSSILKDLAEAFHTITDWKPYYDEALEYQYLISKINVK
ncbi:hypothetical protein ACQVPL_22295 [Bacillus hominis]|uniref:hypothetical protein n=1 Tax=Bacillus hominis TaxID=2817478 RepID=UPI003D65BF00